MVGVINSLLQVVRPAQTSHHHHHFLFFHRHPPALLLITNPDSRQTGRQASTRSWCRRSPTTIPRINIRWPVQRPQPQQRTPHLEEGNHRSTIKRPSEILFSIARIGRTPIHRHQRAITVLITTDNINNSNNNIRTATILIPFSPPMSSRMEVSTP